MNHKQMHKPMLIGAAILLVLALLGVPVGGYLPFLFLLACPLMMVFMMRGMGMDHGNGDENRKDSNAGRPHHEQM